MDIKMDTEKITVASHPSWDLKFSKGIVPIITDSAANMQGAIVASFIQLASIPQLPTVGIPWAQFLTREITLGEIDSKIRQAIFDSGNNSYYPEYFLEGDRLSMSIGERAVK